MPESRLIKARIRDSIAVKQQLLVAPAVDGAAAVAELLVTSLRAGGKTLLFGNGGSAADATHLAAELVGRFKLDRGALPALSLTDNASTVTGIANDYAYERIFARAIEAFGQPGDVAIGLSTSGTSANVLAGLRAASAQGLRSVLFTGANPAGATDAADLCVRIPSEDTARIQEGYMVLGHAICEIVERRLATTPALVLLDRDGTLNRKPPEGEYVLRPEDLELLPGVAAAIRRLNDARVPTAIVTNQRCVARGMLTEPDLDAIHDALRAALHAAAGAYVDAIYHCPHEHGTCHCRKPEPGLLEQAAQRFGAAPGATVVIGDTDSDVEAGRRFGARTVQLTAGPSRATATAPGLFDAVKALVG